MNDCVVRDEHEIRWMIISLQKEINQTPARNVFDESNEGDVRKLREWKKKLQACLLGKGPPCDQTHPCDACDWLQNRDRGFNVLEDFHQQQDICPPWLAELLYRAGQARALREILKLI